MNTSKHEFLSAWLDDETGTFEQRRIVDELHKDEALAQTMSRYALMGELMRKPQTTSVQGTNAFLSRMQLALEDEPAYGNATITAPAAAATKTVKMVSQRRYYAGMGIAATVATVAMGSLLWLQQPQFNQAALQAQTTTTTAPLAVASLPAANTSEQLAATDARIRQLGQVDSHTRDVLKQYVTQHARYASTGIAPSLRAVTYANEN
jgi:sigma-E factor negative regulatory protein RseA